MKKSLKMLSILGFSSFALSGICFGLNSSSVAQTQAATGSTTTTPLSAFAPGNLIYLNITNATDPWWGGTGTYKYGFCFTGNNGTRDVKTYTPFATRAYDGARFFLAFVPAFSDGVTSWSKIVAYCCLSTASTTSDYIASSTPMLVANSASVNEFYTSGTCLVGTSESPAVSQALDQKGWASSRPHVDSLSGWSGIFLSETGTACSSANSQALLDYSWAALSSSYSLLSAEAKTFFTSSTHAEYGTPLYTPDLTSAINVGRSAKGRYLYILKKYTSDSSLTNFAGTNLSAFTNSALTQPSSTYKSSADPLIIGIGVLALVFASAYFFLKKKNSKA